MNAAWRIGAWGLVLAMATGTSLRAAVPSKPGAGLTITQMGEQINKLDEQIGALMPTPKVLADPAFRADTGPKLRPILVQAAALMTQMQKAMEADERLKEAPDLIDAVRTGRFHTMAYAAALGDQENAAALARIAGEKGDDALPAAMGGTLYKWLDASKDSATQEKLLTDYAMVAKAHAEDDGMLESLELMINLGAANDDMQKKVIDVIRTTMKSPETSLVISKLDDLEARKLMVGMAITFSGRTAAGGTFNLAEYKGKVVLLDFWATWCPPCVAEMPAIKAADAKYHAQGLEVVGISCDQDEESLKNFVRDNQMPWVQLHEKTQNEEDNLHPLARKYRITAIPGMFLLDRNGVLRYVDAEEDLEKKIAQLLAEPVKPAAK